MYLRVEPCTGILSCKETAGGAIGSFFGRGPCRASRQRTSWRARQPAAEGRRCCRRGCCVSRSLLKPALCSKDGARPGHVCRCPLPWRDLRDGRRTTSVALVYQSISPVNCCAVRSISSGFFSPVPDRPEFEAGVSGSGLASGGVWRIAVD